MTEPFSDWLSHLVFTGTDLADPLEEYKNGGKSYLKWKVDFGPTKHKYFALIYASLER